MLILRVITLYLLSMSAFAQEQKPITVVELYTSQGCYSCPPADEFLGELKQQTEVIALACHVTYWNYLGWKDTFSKPFCDSRQRNYQRHLKGRAGVYTPQMIINGRYTGVGSQKRTINRIIKFAQRENSILPIELSITNSQIAISLPELDSSRGSLQLYLLATSGNHFLPIAKGENGGKKLHYYNPVEIAKNLGAKKPGEIIYHSLEESSSIKEWVAIAQERPLGKIIAAGKLKVMQ